MIRISKKTDYAIFIMGYLGRKALRSAREGADEPELASAQELASFSSLNKSVVANLLKDLTRAGLLASVRGVHGGYRLAHPATEISLRQILEALEGPFALVECSDADAGASTRAADEQACGCNLSELCTTKRPLQVLEERIGALIDGLKVNELCGLPATAGDRDPLLHAFRPRERAGSGATPTDGEPR